MTLVKVWGKNSGPYSNEIIHNGNLDTSEVFNTAQGVTSGDTAGEGWSIPPPRTNADLRPFYPAQNPYFISYDTVTKSTGSDFSIKTLCPIGYPLGSTVRNETYTRHPQLRSNARHALGLDFYIPEGVGTDPVLRKIIFQTHTVNSPGFSVQEDRNGWFNITLTRNAGTPGIVFAFRFDQLTRGTWHNLVIFITYSPTLSGRCTCWVDRKLARFWSLSGSTYSKGLVPSGTGLYSIDPTRGTLPMSTVDDGTPVTLFDYHGYTMPTDTAGGGDIGNISQKMGYYASSWSTFIRPTSEMIARWQSGDFDIYSGIEKAERVSMINYDDVDGAKYVAPDLRQPELYFSARMSIWGGGQTDEDVFKEVHHAGLAPLEAPDDFTWNEAEPTTYNLTLSSNNTELGTVARNPASGAITAGGTVQLTATPIGAGVLQGWYRNSVSFANLVSTSNPYTLTMNQNENIIGSFIDTTPPEPGQPRKKFAKKRPIT